MTWCSLKCWRVPEYIEKVMLVAPGILFLLLHLLHHLLLFLLS